MDIEAVRAQFPILHQQINGKPLVYFDNAATTQKPQRVIDALVTYYSEYNSNVHRGIHTLSTKATDAFERSRESVCQFIGAKSTKEIIFTRGTTESINLVASSVENSKIDGDKIVVSTLEHHSNIVPWQLAAMSKGLFFKTIPLKKDLSLNLDELTKIVGDTTQLVAVNHASNSLGIINPIKDIIEIAHQSSDPNRQTKVLIDGAQGGAHLPLHVGELDCDFYCISAHKMYGPTGIGVLYGKEQILEQMPPYMSGGEMIKDVAFKGTTFNDLPYKFEAGTPNIADAVAFKAALDFIQEIGKENISAHESMLEKYAVNALKSINKLQILGEGNPKVSIVSFIVEGIHPFDIGQWLDTQGIAVRTGYHCTQPLMDYLGIEGTVRASFSVYNTLEEIDHFVESLKKGISILS